MARFIRYNSKQVETMRLLYDNGVSVSFLSRRFGGTRDTIRAALFGTGAYQEYGSPEYKIRERFG